MVDDIYVTNEDLPLTANVLTNDVGSTLHGTTGTLSVTSFTVGGNTYTAGQTATIPNVGTLIVNANGSLTFMPVANFNGAVPSIEYTATDSNGGADTGVISITVTPVNDAPVAIDDTVTGTEDIPVTGNVLINDTDSDGNTLYVTSFTINGVTYNVGQTANIPGVGSMLLNADGTYTFTPALNYTGTVPAIAYNITDGNGGTDLGALDITIQNANDAPQASDDIVTINQGATASGSLTANDTDIEGNTLTVTGFTIAGITGTQSVGSPVIIPNVGMITINADGTYTFTPLPTFTGNVPIITYTVSDGNGGTDTADLDLFVAPINYNPVAVNDNNTSEEDNPAIGNVLTNDTDQNIFPGSTSPDVLEVTQISFTIAGITYTYPAGMTNTIPGVGTIIVNSNGTYTFTPNTNWFGTVPTITYTVTDGEGGLATGNLVITVTPVNDTPIVANEQVTTPEDTPVSGNVLTNDTDPDGNSLTVTQFTVDGQSYTPGQTATITGVGTIIINSNGTYTFTPAANYNGSVPSIGYTVSDGTLTTDGSIAIYVTPVNDPPVAINDNVSTNENIPKTGSVIGNDSDPENNSLSVTQITLNGINYPAGTLVDIPNVGTIIVNTDGTYTFTPVTGFVGDVPNITYTITDGNGLISSANLAIAVISVNDAPIVTSEQVSTPEDTPVSGNVLTNDTDPDGDPLTVTQFTVGGQSYTPGQTATITGVGTIIVNSNGTYTFTPAAGFSGSMPIIG